MENIISVGYGRKQLSGPLPINTWNSTADVYRDPLYLTCTAVCDGEGVALMFGADLKSCAQSLWTQSAKIIEKKFGIRHQAVDNFAFKGARGMKKMQEISQAASLWSSS